MVRKVTLSVKIQAKVNFEGMGAKPHKLRSNYAIFWLLIIAFLAMQWSSVHIHLAEQHHHDGASHQHQLKTHAHSLSNATDFSHQLSHENVIEFEQSYNLSKVEKQKSPFTAIIALVLSSPPSLLLSCINIPVITHNKLHYCHQSPLNLRAPPVIA